MFLTSCSKEVETILTPTQPITFTMQFFDGTETASFGTLCYRVYCPKELTGQTYVIHVSRGGFGLGNDKGQLLSYVKRYVQKNYVVIQISPARNSPDQFGINSNGFNGIGTPAIFLILGEEEKDINGVGTFMAKDWRLQAYSGMNTNGPRYQIFVKGANTGHLDMMRNNADILQYNLDNSEAFFDTYVKGIDRESEIGNKSIHKNNLLEKSSKGL